MIYGIGLFSCTGSIEVTNKQGYVEYEVLSGYCSDKEAKAAAGNQYSSTYSYRWDGYKCGKKEAVARLEYEIDEAQRKLDGLKFALKVTRKNKWIKKEIAQ